MTIIIGITQLKGGTGRSTIATNLASGMARKGKTLLIDGDMPQATCACWHSLRSELDLNKNLDIETVNNPKDLERVVRQHYDEYKYIILDTPPRIAEVTNWVLMVSDFVLVPITANPADLWATSDLVEAVDDVMSKRDDLNIRVVWNKHRPNTKLTKEYVERFKEDVSIKPLKTTLGFRIAYSEMLGVGKSGFESRDKNARDEINRLTNEVLRLSK